MGRAFDLERKPVQPVCPRKMSIVIAPYDPFRFQRTGMKHPAHERILEDVPGFDEALDVTKSGGVVGEQVLRG